MSNKTANTLNDLISIARDGKDFYEDLTPARLEELIDAFSAGQVPLPGPQNGRFSSEPLGGPVALAGLKGQGPDLNASAALARDIGETVKRIDGTEVPILAKWLRNPPAAADDQTGTDTAPENEPRPAEGQPADATGVTEQEAQAASVARPVSDRNPAGIRAIEEAEQKDDTADR